MSSQPGPIVLLGSGETAPNAQKIYHRLFTQLQEEVRVAILETPAGFEPNSDYVAEQIAVYLRKRLQNFRPAVTIVPARRRDGVLSTDNPEIVGALYNANFLLMGPGSPTYTVRHLHETHAWHVLRAMNRLGATLFFASAATLAMSRQTLPIYEIYKVGEDLHWKPGLDFFDDFGLSLIFVSHWNNNDGGDVLDTSRCYLGQERFGRLLAMLPDDPARRIVGIDENTALVIEPAAARCTVHGVGTVVVCHGEERRIFAAGTTFPIDVLGAFRLPGASDGIPPVVWQATTDGVAASRRARQESRIPGAEVMALVEERDEARRRKDWAESDRLRDEIHARGWQVQDTAGGSRLEAVD
ncbi:MAG: hypothetical protein KDD77_04120 [Caldilineaceae bacterium]|nr:hypothetical protein [Caldilineaceae bacterium]